MNEIIATIQIALTLFIGPPLIFFMAVAIVSAIAEISIQMVADDVQRVRIVGRDDA